MKDEISPPSFILHNSSLPVREPGGATIAQPVATTLGASLDEGAEAGPAGREGRGTVGAEGDQGMAAVGEVTMVAVAEELEVGQVVVEWVAVPVMDVLGWQQWAAEVCGHEQAVPEQIPAFERDAEVALIIHAAAVAELAEELRRQDRR